MEMRITGYKMGNLLGVDRPAGDDVAEELAAHTAAAHQQQWYINHFLSL